MAMLRGILLTLCVCLDVAHLDVVCPYQECPCWLTTVDCNNLQLSEIPQINVSGSTGFTTLNFDTNKISRIPVGSLLPNLTDVDFIQNPIEFIDDAAFDSSASTLKFLTFSFAKFSRIPDAFLHLTALEDLAMYDTKIKDWNDAAMKNIGKTVTSLAFENVGISTWPTWMTYFSQLNYLIISRSLLSSMPDDALESVADKLISLSLFNNSLTAVPKALLKLNKLQTLILYDNKIADVKWLPQSTWLTSLWLQNNKLSDGMQLSNVLFQYGECLVDLDIRNNQLTTIPEFDFFTQLGGFDFSHNKIADPLSGKFRVEDTYSVDLSYNLLPKIPNFLSSLRLMNFLVVPYNSIRRIQSSDFSTTVSGIELGFNLITELRDDSFPKNSAIAVLHLDNNPITTVSPLAFKNLAQLKELNMQGSKLTRLPLALQSLTSLSMFDMTGSNALVCTCMEKSLGQWVLTQTPEGVLGNCGQASIYDFLTKLSPLCPDQSEISV